MKDALPVKDMPIGLSDACRERGYEPTHEMTFEQALREWAAWHLGDKAWADDMIKLQSDFATDLRHQT